MIPTVIHRHGWLGWLRMKSMKEAPPWEGSWPGTWGARAARRCATWGRGLESCWSGTVWPCSAPGPPPSPPLRLMATSTGTSPGAGESPPPPPTSASPAWSTRPPWSGPWSWASRSALVWGYNHHALVFVFCGPRFLNFYFASLKYTFI